MKMGDLYREFEKMCENLDFDIVRAEEILKQIDVNQEFITSEHHFRVDPLAWAGHMCSNLKMVKLLLEHGADPNHLYDGEENVLWQMQYAEENVGNFEIINEARLEIVELLLKYGANPHMNIGEDDLLKHANECRWDDEGIQYDYRLEFICLLERFDDMAVSDKKRMKPYIPRRHKKYNLLPHCRKEGGEVFDYPSKLMQKLEEYMQPGDQLDPYGYDSYKEYFEEIDRIAKKYADKPEVMALFEQFIAQMKEMNCKDEWSVLKYIGPNMEGVFTLTPGRDYYWPVSKSNPVYSGVIDDEEYTSYLYPTDSDMWEILEDPTGMAYNTIYGTGRKVNKKRYNSFMEQIKNTL